MDPSTFDNKAKNFTRFKNIFLEMVNMLQLESQERAILRKFRDMMFLVRKTPGQTLEPIKKGFS